MPSSPSLNRPTTFPPFLGLRRGRESGRWKEGVLLFLGRPLPAVMVLVGLLGGCRRRTATLRFWPPPTAMVQRPFRPQTHRLSPRITGTQHTVPVTPQAAHRLSPRVTGTTEWSP